MDIKTPSARSINMSHIKSHNTKPELLVRKYLFSQGFRYRINDKRYPGHPDVVLPKYKTCIFINGCFWHIHEGCKYFVWPENNKESWRQKLTANKERDKMEYLSLQNMGWKVIIIWECELRKANRESTLKSLTNELRHLM